MSPHHGKKLAAVAALGVTSLVAAGLVLTAGTGSAVPVSLTLNYTCPFPLIGSQPIKVVISSDIPTSINVGQATPPFDIKAVSTVPATATQGLTLVGASTIEGTAVSSDTVTVPEATLPVDVPVVVQKTNIPASGPFDIVATGQTPSLTFSQPGKGTISVGGLKLTMTPKKADGSPTGLGTFDSVCTQDAGQNNVLTTFDIIGNTPTSTTTTTTTTTTSTTTTTKSTTTTTPTTTTTTTQPGGGGVKYGYNLAGTSTLPKLNGSVPLNGGIDANLDLATGNYTADLTLQPTSGNFKLFNFLPVTAKVAFQQVGQTTGSLSGGVLKSDSKMNILLPQITVFGLPISSSADCGTTSPSDIQLASGANFDPLAGGTITGTYSIAALKGCGQLNDFISAFTASDGNTISAKLTPKQS